MWQRVPFPTLWMLLRNLKIHRLKVRQWGVKCKIASSLAATLGDYLISNASSCFFFRILFVGGQRRHISFKLNFCLFFTFQWQITSGIKKSIRESMHGIRTHDRKMEGTVETAEPCVWWEQTNVVVKLKARSDWLRKTQ